MSVAIQDDESALLGQAIRLAPGAAAHLGDYADPASSVVVTDAALSLDCESCIFPAGEPKAKQIDALADHIRKAGADTVIAIGGGSVMDAAKYAALLASQDDACAEDFKLCEKPLPEKRIRMICLPSTAGTGSEATRTVVFTAADGIKYWAWGDELRPDLALLDPDLTLGLPPAVAAMTGLDAFVHALEAHTNKADDADASRFAMAALRLVSRHLEQACRPNASEDARAGMLQAAALAGRAIDAAGTGMAHGIGHALGSLAPMPHGLAVSLGMAAVLPSNVAAAPAAHREAAKALGLTGEGDILPWLQDMMRSLPLPDHRPILSGVEAKTLAAAVMGPANQSMRASNCHDFSAEEVLALSCALLEEQGV